MLQDWPIVAASLGAALVPYLIERFVFGRRIGVFAFLFWLLALQFLAIYLSVAVVGSLEDNGWVILAELLKGIAAIAFMTIGIVPFVALPLAVLIALAVLGFRLFSRVR